MPNLHRFLSRRRLLGFLAGLALIFGLLMLHPYPRQSLFGPTIRGKPWCEWEWEFRRLVHWRDTQKPSLSEFNNGPALSRKNRIGC